MLSTRKPEEPNFNFNHVRGSQEAFGQPPWTGPGPWARGPGPSWSKHRREIRVTGAPTPTHTIPGRAEMIFVGDQDLANRLQEAYRRRDVDDLEATWREASPWRPTLGGSGSLGANS